MPIRFLIGALSFFFVSTPLFSSPLYDDIEITSSSDNELSFILKIDNPGRYIFPDDSDSTFTASKAVLIGIPPNSGIALGDVRASEPIPTETRLKSIGSGFAQIDDVFFIRGRKVARIIIYPYRDGVFYSRLELDIKFSERVGGGDSGREIYMSDRAFEAVYEYSLLNFDRFRLWPVYKKAVGFKAAQAAFFGVSEWYKIVIGGEGITRITGQELQAAGLSLNNLASDRIRLFYGGGRPLPPENGQPQPTLREVSITVADGGDGLFNLSDSIIFFAEGADRWHYPADSSPVFLSNHYTNANYYWLTVSESVPGEEKRIEEIDGSISGLLDTIFTTGQFCARVEDNNILSSDAEGHITDYYSWYWTDERQTTIYEPLVNARPGDSALISIRAKSNVNVGLRVNNVTAVMEESNPPFTLFTTRNLVGGLNQFRITLDSTGGMQVFLDYCDIAFDGDLVLENNPLDFHIAPSSGRAGFTITRDNEASPRIYDISAPDHPIRIINADISPDDIRFSRDLNNAAYTRFLVLTEEDMLSPGGVEKVVIDDLRSNYSQTDMLIIAPAVFVPVLEDYKTYREEESGVSVRIVPLEQIYYQFSFGQLDPVAIRNFIKYTYENYPDPVPSAVLLVGDGSYDFENHLGFQSLNLVPPYIHPLDSSASDDNYVFFGSYGILDSDTSYVPQNPAEDRGYDMMISRWPVKSTADLQVVIDKIRAYESSVSFGTWRTNVTLVADDEFGKYNTEWFHTTQTEELQEPSRLPSKFRRNKIYLWDYPFDSNRKKPQVNQAIIRSFNEGTLLINYIGHGNPNTWAHENVFNRNSDIPQLHNADRLALVLSFSCSIGFFDEPSREGMAEELFRLAAGGAIGTVSATRLVYSSDNAAFNRQVFQTLFESGDLTICQAFFAAKIIRQYSSGDPKPVRNDRNYSYLGDPFVYLDVPRYEVAFTEVPEILSALKKHDVAGNIVERNTGIPVDFNGTLDVMIYDSDIKKEHKVVNDYGTVVKTVDYDLTGPAIYRGRIEVIDGQFEFSFIAPLDIGYGGQTANISAYGFSDLADALGRADSIPVSLDITPGTDSAGPNIAYTFNDAANFASGDIISPSGTMGLTIEDESGINLSGALGHAITLIIDDEVESTVNLTDLFQYEPGSYTSGRISYDFDGLSGGLHRFKIKAWDNANNSSSAEFEAEVSQSDRMMLVDLLNYPNPMHDRTTFSFSLTSPARNVKLEIFTLSGKRIAAYNKPAIPAGYSEFYSWNGRDAEMDRVATGVYIYKVTAVSETGGETAESYGKLVVID